LRIDDCGLTIDDCTSGFPSLAQSSCEPSIRNPQSKIPNPFSRRHFFSTVLLLPATAALSFAADPLCVLKPNDFERLKLDFNSNRDSVRLLFVLSPT
jgi:hypothetical protein